MPAPARLDREIYVNYGNIQIGPDSDTYEIHDRFRHVKSWDRAVVEFNVMVRGATVGEFADNCNAIEAAFSEPDKSLLVTQGAATLVSYAAAPEDYCRPTIQKSAGEADTGRSRLYTVRIDIDPKASMLSPQGLRDVSVDVSFSPARRRTVNISGTVTAISGSSARSQYTSIISSYCSAALSGLGGTYELVGEPVQALDRPGHLLRFHRTYRERLAHEGGSSLDDEDLFEQTATFTRVRPAPGDTDRLPMAGGGTSAGGAGDPVKRLTQYDVQYVAYLAQGVDFDTKWNTIRDWLLRETESQFGASGLALVNERSSFDIDDRRISASLSLLGAEEGTTLLERRVSATDDDDDDEILVPAWTGKRFSRHRYDAPTDLVRTVTETARFLGDMTLGQAHARAKSLFMTGRQDIREGDEGVWSRGRITARVTPLRLGTEDHPLNVTDVEITIRRRFFNPVVRNTQAP